MFEIFKKRFAGQKGSGKVEEKIHEISSKEYDNENKFFLKISNARKFREIDSLLNSVFLEDEEFNESYESPHHTSIGGYSTYDHPGINNEYDTNIENKTCSCKDWIKTRGHYDIFDPRRLCKHLVQKLTDSDIQQHYPYYQQEIAFYKNEERGFKRNFDEIVDLSKFGLMVFVDEWSDVFDHEGNRYGFKFDWETGSKIWTKGNKPKGYKEVEKIFQDRFVQPKYLSMNEFEEIGVWLEKHRTYDKCEFAITTDSMYILPPGVLCYQIMDIDCNLQYEVKNIYCNDRYLRIDYWNNSSDYFSRLKPSFSSDPFIEWRNYKDPNIEKQKIEDKKYEIRSKGFTIDGVVKTDFYCEPENIDIDGYKIEDYLLLKYPEISKQSFHIRLKKMGIISNPNYRWIFTEKGLKYGYNLIVDHTYKQIVQNFPSFYCDSDSKEFIRYSHSTTTDYGDILYPNCIALYDESTFEELIELYYNS